MAVHHRGYIPSAFPTYRELLHLTGGEEEVGVVEEKRGSSDMDGEERGGVPVEDPDRRIKRQHVSGHSARIVPSLHVKVPHQHPLYHNFRRVGFASTPQYEREDCEQEEQGE